jgi:hypothetical protein
VHERIETLSALGAGDRIDIRTAPPYADCAALGSDGYPARARRECRASIDLLRRALGDEPLGARLAIRPSPHDFGNHLSVVGYYEPENEEEADYAFRCESRGPPPWDNKARRRLAESIAWAAEVSTEDRG